MGMDLDSIPELLEDFKTELRRQNRAKSTIDTYARDVGYFVSYLETREFGSLASDFDILRRQLGASVLPTPLSVPRSSLGGIPRRDTNDRPR
ncbi:hypothetical protein [Nocardia terpenica]|uniref:Core-binding (CB) domain-containing protein n=1 Tax=Nocardia terpenica TaxID=455432 RepID=A0A6G9YZE1_9NOCA|nr:hypothetical protein [Nocardia terpenica]QIS18487.1 hypothetical protein F6W96_09515 [Nocardia terpenica]